MTLSHIVLYNIHKTRIGEKEAQALTDYITGEIEDQYKAKAQIVATKVDLAELKVDVIRWMIGMFLGQTGIILGFLYFMIRK